VLSKIRAAALSLAVAGLLVAGCKPPPAPETKDETPAQTADTPPEAPTATGPVARVNGTELPRDTFQRQMDRTRARFERAGRQIAPALESRLKENLIRKMVDDELIRQKAKSEGVTVEAAELEAKFAEHRQRFGSDKAFTAFLERTSQSEADVNADLERNLLRDKLFGKLMAGQEPGETDAKTYYEENQDKYKQREQVRASHILLKVARTDPPEVKAEKEKKAKDLFKQAKKPGADFAALAREHSEGPTASKGGDLGPFSRGRMVKEFEDAAFAAKAGKVLGPVETKFGFHVIKVFEKTPERQRAYDEVKESILTSLQARAKSRATREILKTMKTDAKIEVLEPGVELDRRAQRPTPMAPDGTPLAAGRPGGVGVKTAPINPNANPAAAARARAALQKTRIEATKVPKAAGAKDE
jgi:peptidyl-prolyl cis-trans isomerase C